MTPAECRILQQAISKCSNGGKLAQFEMGCSTLKTPKAVLPYEDRIGNLGLQAAGHRASRTLAATFTGITALPGEFKIVGRPEREIAVKDVFNEVVGFIRQYETLTDELVFERQDFIQIDRGGSVELFADFEGAAVSDLDDPVSGTDYNAYENMEGTGTNWAFALTVDVEISQFNEIKVVVNYPVQTGYPPSYSSRWPSKALSSESLATCQRCPDATSSSIEKYKIKTHELRTHGYRVKPTWRHGPMQY